MLILNKTIESNQMLLWKELNYQRPTLVAWRSSRDTCKCYFACEIGGGCVCTHGISDLMVLGVCCEFLCPLQSLCHALSSGVNHNATARMAASPISVPCRQPNLGAQYHRGLGLFERWPLYPIQWVEPQGWGHLRVNLGFGVFWFIPPLLVGPISSQSPL